MVTQVSQECQDLLENRDKKVNQDWVVCRVEMGLRETKVLLVTPV